jgi:ectoine hydroxylase-related dioxygenase (phytanoyl-CoA dioxygenase family)
MGAAEAREAPASAALFAGVPALGARIELPRELSNAQVQQFVTDGFLVLPNLLTADEIDEIRRDAVAIFRGRYPCAQIEPVAETLDDDAVLRRILCIHQPHFISPVIERYARHPRICGVLSQIVAAHLPAWDGSVKCMQSMLFVKGPDSPGQAWHQDEIYIPTRDRSLCGAWIALDDATRANGCLWVLPGSHRTGYLYPQRQHEKLDEFDFAEESFGFDDAAEVPVEVPAGGVVFFNGYLLHRSRRNRSSVYRRALVNHYMNAWSLLPWEVAEGQRPAIADVRRIISVAGVDPYAWKGYVRGQDVWLRPRKA